MSVAPGGGGEDGFGHALLQVVITGQWDCTSEANREPSQILYNKAFPPRQFLSLSTVDIRGQRVLHCGGPSCPRPTLTLPTTHPLVPNSTFLVVAVGNVSLPDSAQGPLGAESPHELCGPRVEESEEWDLLEPQRAVLVRLQSVLPGVMHLASLRCSWMWGDGLSPDLFSPAHCAFSFLPHEGRDSGRRLARSAQRSPPPRSRPAHPAGNRWTSWSLLRGSRVPSLARRPQAVLPKRFCRSRNPRGSFLGAPLLSWPLDPGDRP